MLPAGIVAGILIYVCNASRSTVVVAITNLCSVQVLVLADNTFQPFPTDTTPASAKLHALSGEVLQLREHGLSARDAFEQEVRLSSTFYNQVV